MAHKHRARTYETRTQEDQQWRDEAAQALENAGYYALAHDFRMCGHPDAIYSYVVCSNDLSHFAKPIPHTCHQRGCSECAWRETARIFKRYNPHILKAVRSARYHLRMVVLTTDFSLHDPDAREKLRSSWDAVSDTFDELLGSDWTRQGQGYLGGSEFGEKGQKIHFHILFYGRYLDKYKLSEIWEKHTGAKVTYVKLVRNPEKAIAEVTKYSTKLTELPPKDIVKLHEVLKGTRRIRSRGIFYNLPIDEEGRNATCPECGQPLKLMGKSTYEFWRQLQAEEADRMLLDEPAPGVVELDLILGNKSPPKLPGFEGYEPRPIYF